MNYRHLYHAGSFSDVLKHITLIALMNALIRKETPFCYLDTHAGAGYYDLFSDCIRGISPEYKMGIEKILVEENPPPLVQQYLNCIQRIHRTLALTSTPLRYYPGSPMIAHTLLRAQDRAIVCEWQLQEYQALKSTFAGQPKIAVHHQDGFLGLKAFLPPLEHRGLVLIDPPYENPDEWTHITRALIHALSRFEKGIYAIWYPLKEKAQVSRWKQNLRLRIKQPILFIELSPYQELPQFLSGSGLAILNPPWQFDQSMHDVLPWLWKALTINEEGGFSITS